MAGLLSGFYHPRTFHNMQEIEMSQQTRDWSELAITLYDKLTGRNAEITYEAEDMEVWVPSGVGEDATHARWKLNGSLKIRARDGVQA